MATDPEKAQLDVKSAKRLIRGQQLVVASVLMSLAASAVRWAFDPLVGTFGSVLALAVLLLGLRWMVLVLGFSYWENLLLLVLLCIPIVNLVALARVSASATQALHVSGFRAGLFRLRHDRTPNSPQQATRGFADARLSGRSRYVGEEFGARP